MAGGCGHTILEVSIFGGSGAGGAGVFFLSSAKDGETKMAASRVSAAAADKFPRIVLSGISGISTALLWELLSRDPHRVPDRSLVWDRSNLCGRCGKTPYCWPDPWPGGRLGLMREADGRSGNSRGSGHGSDPWDPPDRKRGGAPRDGPSHTPGAKPAF